MDEIERLADAAVRWAVPDALDTRVRCYTLIEELLIVNGVVQLPFPLEYITITIKGPHD